MTSYVAMATKKLKNIFLTKSPTHSMKGLAIKIQLKCFIKIKIFIGIQRKTIFLLWQTPLLPVPLNPKAALAPESSSPPGSQSDAYRPNPPATKRPLGRDPPAQKDW